MNWKSTLLLLILTGAAGAWLWKGDQWLPQWAPPAAPADSPVVATLERDFSPANLVRIEVRPPGADPFLFVREADGWSQPGGWPLRAAEVNELVDTLGTLRTRFHPIPIANGDLSPFGLAEAQKPFVVQVKTATTAEYTLRFGEPPAQPGDVPFTRPAYVQINNAPEVLKLGPDVMPVLRRPADAYRRRQLFAEVERVKFAGTPALTQPGLPPEPPVPNTVTLPGPAVQQIQVRGKIVRLWGKPIWFASENFTLQRIAPTPRPTVTERNAEPTVQPDRLADAWIVVAPHRDQANPATLQRVLAALPDLWVEKFLASHEVGFAVDHPYSIAQMMPIPLEPLPALLARIHPSGAFLMPLADRISPEARAGIDRSQHAISVTQQGGKTVTVKLGGFTFVQREETETIRSPIPEVNPRTEKRLVTVAYRLAQVDGNPQIVTVPADKVQPIFATAADVIDSRVARFSAEEVWAITIFRPNQPPIQLSRKKGNPRAFNRDDREDRWLIEGGPNPLLADRDRVEDLLSRLANLRGDPTTDLYRTDPLQRGLDPERCVRISLVVREKRPAGEPDAPSREYTILVGTPDFAQAQLPVQRAGWPRISLVKDRIASSTDSSWLGEALFPERLEPTFRRDAITYRSRKLFDTADTTLTGIVVEGEKGFTLQHQKKPSGGDGWQLTLPITSDTNPQTLDPLVTQLTGLQAREFLVEQPTNLAEYGLDKPSLTVKLTFSNNRRYTLEIGKPRPGKKEEVFARLDGGAVFTLAASTTERLAAGPLELLPQTVWSVAPNAIQAVEITRFDKPEESFTLTPEGTNWKLTGPFTAPVPFLSAQPMLTQLGNLTATKYESLQATDPAKYGFDKPLAKVKLTYREKTTAGERTVTQALIIGSVSAGVFDQYAQLDVDKAPVFILPAAYRTAVQTAPLALLDRNLLYLDASRITQVQITGEKPENAITLSRDDKGQWKAAEATFTVDKLVATELVDTLASLPIDRIAAYGEAVKWAEYGLDKPEYTIVITLSGEKPQTRTLRFGKSDPTGGRFVRVDEGLAVGVLSATVAQSLARSKLDFAERTFFSFKAEELLGLVRQKGSEELEIAPGGGDGWEVVKPTKIKADTRLVEELGEALSRLRAEKVVAVGKKAEIFPQYGLEPAEAILTLTIGEKLEQKVLRLGRPVDATRPTGERYAAVETATAEATVGILPANLVNKLLAPPVSFRDRTIARFVDADALTLERPGRTITFSKVAGTWKVTQPITADAEQSALDDLVNELAQLRASDWVAFQPNPQQIKDFGLENPQAIWTVKNGTKVELILRIGKKTDDGRVYATTATGELVALLGVPQTTKILGEYRVRKPWTLDAFQAESVTIARGDNRFTLKKDGSHWKDATNPDAIDSAAVSDLLSRLASLQVERFVVDKDADGKLFGLAPPEFTITVTLTDGSTRELAIGGIVGGTGDKQRYARVVDKDRSDVFILSAADTERFTRDRSSYLQKK
ncbi:MAG: DUF4340 domain-containing protein [Gemmataceae bacterium]|nr:DUF4340 domain-containing protein [Gemmata sp.]MDW8196022.1 DUF4340 domain-containing protein [Gemmataceae bacterium]